MMDERAFCADCGTELESVRPGKHQHPGDTLEFCNELRAYRRYRAYLIDAGRFNRLYELDAFLAQDKP